MLKSRSPPPGEDGRLCRRLCQPLTGVIDGKAYAGISLLAGEKANSWVWAGAQVLGICKRGGRKSCLAKHYLGHGVMIGGGIAPGHVVLELPLDIGEQTRRAEAEEVGLEPTASEFLAYQDQPLKRRLGGGNASGGLEADAHARAFMVGADGAYHGKADGQGGVDAFLSRRGLDEVGAGHHRHHGGERDVAQRGEVPRAEDDLQMRIAA